MGRLVSQKELAEIWGVSARVILDWQAEGMPVKQPGKRGRASKIDTAEATEWRIKREVEKKLKTTESSRAKQTAAERLKHWQAEKAEVETQRMRRELVPAEDVRQALMNTWTFLGRQLDAIASRVAKQLAKSMKPADVRKVLLDEIRRARTVAAKDIAAQGFDPADPDTVGRPRADKGDNRKPSRPAKKRQRKVGARRKRATKP